MKTNTITRRRVVTSPGTPLPLRPARTRPAPSAHQVQQSWQSAEAWMTTLHDVMYESAEAPGKLGEAAGWQLSGDAKRIRARLALAAGHALGADLNQVVRVAAAVELLHEASLVHDDLQDRDELRRGKSTVWVEYGDELAITLGDWLINQAYDVIMQMDADPAVVLRLTRSMSKAVADTVRGQAVENGAKSDLSTSCSDYIDMATGKTAPLLAFPLEAVALLSGRSERERVAIRNGLECLGGAYQLRDDLIDLLGQKGRGLAGADLIEGKATLPALIYYQNANDLERHDLETFLSGTVEQRTAAAQLWSAKLVESAAFDEVCGTVDGLIAMGYETMEAAPHAVTLLVKSVFGRLLAPVQRPEQSPVAALAGQRA